MEKNKPLKNIKIDSNFLKIFDTRVKSIFVRFFILSTFYKNSEKIGILESENQIIFLYLA